MVLLNHHLFSKLFIKSMYYLYRENWTLACQRSEEKTFSTMLCTGNEGVTPNTCTLAALCRQAALGGGDHSMATSKGTP